MDIESRMKSLGAWIWIAEMRGGKSEHLSLFLALEMEGGLMHVSSLSYQYGLLKPTVHILLHKINLIHDNNQTTL